MTISIRKEEMLDVPTQVFEKFLQALGSAGASPQLIERLRKVLLEDQTFTEQALKAAVFDEEKLP